MRSSYLWFILSRCFFFNDIVSRGEHESDISHQKQNRGRVAKTLRRIPRQRAVGPDEIASEIWIAGGDRLAELLCELMKRVVASGTITPQWKGGRLARLYKGKGDAADCNSHRGLLIAEHASKVFTSLLWPPIARVCDKRLPTEQQRPKPVVHMLPSRSSHEDGRSAHRCRSPSQSLPSVDTYRQH